MQCDECNMMNAIWMHVKFLMLFAVFVKLFRTSSLSTKLNIKASKVW